VPLVVPLRCELIVARRYFAEKSEKAQSPRKDEEDESTGTLAKMPHDPMAERRTPCIKTISTTVSRTQLEDVPPSPLKLTVAPRGYRRI
jgi:hypothetical protein